MQKVVINIGDKLEMTHVKSVTRTKLSESRYGSMLLDYDGIRKAKISMPILEGRIVPLQIGDEYELCFYVGASLYRCRAKIAGRGREGKLHVLRVEFLTQPKKFQRRQFFRLDCLQKIQYRPVARAEKILMDFIAAAEFESDTVREAYEKKLSEYKKEWRQGTLTDISGGGVRIQCEDDVETETLLEVTFLLRLPTETIQFTSLARVVMNVKAEGSKLAENELRCEFENMSEEKRELIIKYVFEEQKKRLRKE